MANNDDLRPLKNIWLICHWASDAKYYFKLNNWINLKISKVTLKMFIKMDSDIQILDTLYCTFTCYSWNNKVKQTVCPLRLISWRPPQHILPIQSNCTMPTTLHMGLWMFPYTILINICVFPDWYCHLNSFFWTTYNETWERC